MATNFINTTEGEILDFYINEDYQFIKGLSTTITEGVYVKLPTHTYLFVDFSAVTSTEVIAKPQNIGYLSNNVIQELEKSYEI